jgi:hypothetical protein
VEEALADSPRLKVAIASYGHTKALKSGEVPIKGVDPDFIEVVPIIGAFRRMVRDVEFDVCEMAPTTYMIARSLYDAFVEAKKPYIAHLKGSEGDSADEKKYRGLMPLVGDPLPFGLEANMPSIEALLTYGLQQKLIPARMPLDEVFVDPEKI